MEFSSRIKVKDGEEKNISTPLGDITVHFENGLLNYTRTIKDSPDDNTVKKSFLVGREGKQVFLSFLPVYPDRPLIFRLTDNITVPPGEKGFFSLQLEIGIGLTITGSDTLIEEILPAKRKNSYWGPPTQGILSYQYKSSVSRDPVELAHETEALIAVVPVNFFNQRDVVQEITRCLIPLRELDIYQTPENELVFETVQLIQRGENDQVPKPLKRAPKEFSTNLKRISTAPNKPRTLLEKVSVFSGWQQFSGVFLDR